MRVRTEVLHVAKGSWNVPACACDAEEQIQDAGVRTHLGEQELGREL